MLTGSSHTKQSPDNARENFLSTMRSVGVFAGLTAISRVGGLARDLLFAFLLGGSIYADLFWVAFRLPNLFRKIVAEGAMDAAFVPRYQRALSGSCVYASRRLIFHVLSFMVPWVSGISVAIIIAMPFLAYVLAPGIVDAEPYHDTVVILMRIMFPYLLCMVVVSIFSGAANSHGHFGPGAACPILLNVSMVTVLSAVALHTDAHNIPIPPEHIVTLLSVAVLLAGIFQVLWMVMAWFFWVRPSLSGTKNKGTMRSNPVTASTASTASPWRDHHKREKTMISSTTKRSVLVATQRLWRLSPRIRSMLKTLCVTVLVGSLFQINLVIDQVIASTVGIGAISHIFFADRLVQLPLALIGISAGNVMLAKISGAVAHRSKDTQSQSAIHGNAVDTINGVTLVVWSLVIPSTIGLVIFAHPLVTALYQRGAFGSVDADITAQVLTMLALGLPAFSLVKPLTAVVYAHQAARMLIPMAVISIPINVVWSLWLKEPLGAAGIALATSITSWFYLVAVAFLVVRRGWWNFHVWREKKARWVLFSCVVMALVVLMGAWMVLYLIRSSVFPNLLTSPWLFAVLIPALLGAMFAYVGWWWWWWVPRMITIINTPTVSDQSPHPSTP